MIYERMNLGFMKLRLHGEDSSLFLLEVDDDTETLDEIAEVILFTITPNRNPAREATDILTIKLDTPELVDFFVRASFVDLRIGSTRSRYKIETRTTTPQTGGGIGFADLTQKLNERTPTT